MYILTTMTKKFYIGCILILSLCLILNIFNAIYYFSDNGITISKILIIIVSALSVIITFNQYKKKKVGNTMKELFRPHLKNIILYLTLTFILGIITILTSPSSNSYMIFGVVSPATLLLVLTFYVAYCFYDMFYGKQATITRTLSTEKSAPFSSFVSYVIYISLAMGTINSLFTVIIEYQTHLFAYTSLEFIQFILLSLIATTGGYLMTISILMLMVSIIYSNSSKVKNNYLITTLFIVFGFFVAPWIVLIGIMLTIINFIISALALWQTSRLYTKNSIIKNQKAGSL